MLTARFLTVSLIVPRAGCFSRCDFGLGWGSHVYAVRLFAERTLSSLHTDQCCLRRGGAFNIGPL